MENKVVREGSNRRVNLELHDVFLKALNSRCIKEGIIFRILHDNRLDNKYDTIVELGGIEAYQLVNIGSNVGWQFIGYTNTK